MFPSKTQPGSRFIPGVADLTEHTAVLPASASGVAIGVSPAREVEELAPTNISPQAGVHWAQQE